MSSSDNNWNLIIRGPYNKIETPTRYWVSYFSIKYSTAVLLITFPYKHIKSLQTIPSHLAHVNIAPHQLPISQVPAKPHDPVQSTTPAEYD